MDFKKEELEIEMCIRRILPFFLFLLVVSLLATGCSGPEEKKMKFFNKGMALYEAGDLVKANLEFKNALQVDPKFARAYEMLGRIAYDKRNWKGAYKRLSQAVSLDEGLLDSQLYLGRLLLMGREAARAEEKADLVLAREPDNERALALKAGCRASLGDAPEAERLLREVLGRHGDDIEAAVMLARLRMQAGDQAEAVAVLQSALNQKPEHRLARIMLAEVLEKNGDLSGAESQYKLLIEGVEDKSPYRLLLARFYERTGRSGQAEGILKEMISSNPEEERYRLGLARFYGQHKNPEAMLRVLEETIRDMPDKYGAYEMLARYRASEKGFDEALSVLDRFLNRVESGPSRVQARLFKAEILTWKRELDAALALVEDVLKTRPGEVQAHALRGNILASQGRFVDAISAYRSVLNEEPGNIEVLLKLARVHALNGESGLAEATYRRVIEREPENRAALFGLAGLARRNNRPDAARGHLEKILTSNPDDGAALLALGDLAMARRDAKSARKYYEHLKELAPKSPMGMYKVGLVEMVEGRTGKAMALFEGALSANPDYAPALEQILGVLVRQGKLDEAVERCRRQSEASPKNARYLIALGRLYGAKKDYTRARAIFEQALEVDPNSQDAIFDLARLASTQGSVEEAIKRMEGLHKKNPDHAGFSLFLALLYEQASRQKESKAIYEEVLKKRPGIWIAANNLAFYLAEFEPSEANLSRARELLAPLLAKENTPAEVEDTWAWVLYRQGEYQKAREVLEGISASLGKNPAYNYHLGMIHLGLKNEALARRFLQEALTTGQEFPGRQEAEKALKAIE